MAGLNCTASDHTFSVAHKINSQLFGQIESLSRMVLNADALLGRADTIGAAASRRRCSIINPKLLGVVLVVIVFSIVGLLIAGAATSIGIASQLGPSLQETSAAVTEIRLLFKTWSSAVKILCHDHDVPQNLWALLCNQTISGL